MSPQDPQSEQLGLQYILFLYNERYLQFKQLRKTTFEHHFHKLWGVPVLFSHIYETNSNQIHRTWEQRFTWHRSCTVLCRWVWSHYCTSTCWSPCLRLQSWRAGRSKRDCTWWFPCRRLRYRRAGRSTSNSTWWFPCWCLQSSRAGQSASTFISETLTAWCGTAMST